jgi:tRNA (guanine37-N1)-methyltransferase
MHRALENGIISVDFYNPRDYSTNRYKKVDEPMIGGGAGMLMSPQPLDDAISDIRGKSPQAYVLFLSPAGKPFNQNDARRLSAKKHIVLVAGRYEGIDERVLELQADEVFSTGDFILTGGELPALMLCDSISRNIKGVLGNSASLHEESFEAGLLEAPSFTKPDSYKGKRVISEFLKGNHSKIAAIKKQMALSVTKYFRPDLYSRVKAEK